MFDENDGETWDEVPTVVEASIPMAILVTMPRGAALETEA